MTYKIKEKEKLIALLLFIIAISFLIPIEINRMQSDEVKEVKCYDEFRNEIKGETCLEKDFWGKDIEPLFLLTFVFSSFCWVICHGNNPLRTDIIGGVRE